MDNLDDAVFIIAEPKTVSARDVRSCCVCSRIFAVKGDNQRNAVLARCSDCARANKHPKNLKAGIL